MHDRDPQPPDPDDDGSPREERDLTAVWHRWILARTVEDRAAALAMARLWSRASGEAMPACMEANDGR